MIVCDVRIKSSAASISILWRLSGREAAAIRPSGSPVVKKKLDAEAVTPGLAVGIKTVIVIQRARSARNILLFIFVSLLGSKGMLSQDEQQSDESQN